MYDVYGYTGTVAASVAMCVCVCERDGVTAWRCNCMWKRCSTGNCRDKNENGLIISDGKVYFSAIAVEMENLHNSRQKMRDTQEEGGLGEKCELGRKRHKRSESGDSNIE